MKSYYTYILKCKDNSYYVGVTNDINRRLEEHNQGEDKKAFTYLRRPVRLVWYEEFRRINDAIDCEKQLKGWSRKKKEALIEGRYELLPSLARTAKHYDIPLE